METRLCERGTLEATTRGGGMRRCCSPKSSRAKWSFVAITTGQWRPTPGGETPKGRPQGFSGYGGGQGGMPGVADGPFRKGENESHM